MDNHFFVMESRLVFSGTWIVCRRNVGHDFAEGTRRKDFVRAKLKNGEYNVTGDITDDIISNPLEPNREEHWSSPILAF